jgi:hypothetical protein
MLDLIAVLLPQSPPEPRGARVVSFEPEPPSPPEPKPERVFQTLAERRAKRRMYTKAWKAANRDRQRQYKREWRRKARELRK